MSFLSWTISALTWHHSTHASTPLHCTSSAEDLKDVSRYDTLPCTFCCCFASCSYIGHYSILDSSGGGEHIVIHIGWVIICVIKDIWSHVCKMGRLEQAMTRGGNKWKWSGKTEREKKNLALGNLPDSLSLNQSDVLQGKRKQSFKAIFKGKCLKSLYCISSSEGHIQNILKISHRVFAHNSAWKPSSAIMVFKNIFYI